MKIGVFGTLTDTGIKIDELARAVEERGFDSLWIGEHSHVPVAVSSHPRENGAPLPDFYRRLPDPFVQLGAAAAVTTRITLGTSVCIIPQHDPIMLAKQVATIDYLSWGRFQFGVGYGWNELEMKHHGIDVKFKREVFREKLLAMRALWEQDVADFDGTFVKFSPSYAWPKPVQSRIPVLIGAEAGPKTIGDIVELAEGWLPMDLRGGGDRLPSQLSALRQKLTDTGNAARTLNVTLMDPLLAFKDHAPEVFSQRLSSLRGKSMVERFNLSALVIGVPFFDRDRALKHLDSAASFFLN
jgi:probable F420-dependent oxidoreductase